MKRVASFTFSASRSSRTALRTALVAAFALLAGAPSLSLDVVSNFDAASGDFLWEGRLAATANVDLGRNVQGLPNVLIVGGADAVAYTSVVRKELQGKFNVYGVLDGATGAAYSSSLIDQWLDGKKWHSIVFHWSRRDLAATTSTELGAYLRQTTDKFKATGAALYFANIPPVPESVGLTFDGRERLDVKIRRLNDAAAKVMLKKEVKIIDLYRLLTPHQSDYIAAEGRRLAKMGLYFVGKVVASAIVDPETVAANYASPKYVYYAIILSYQLGDFNPPDYRSHTFGVFVKATPARRVLDKVEISWLPAKGFASPFVAYPVKGKNFSTEETCTIAIRQACRISKWGPYEIRPELFYLAGARARDLESGKLRYILLDKNWRRQHNTACMCVHALSDTVSPLLISGDKHGEAGSRAVVDHFKSFIVGPLNDGDWLDRALGISKFHIFDRTHR